VLAGQFPTVTRGRANYVATVFERALSSSEEGEAGHYRYNRQVPSLL
jgi:hypothetical protein